MHGTLKKQRLAWTEDMTEDLRRRVEAGESRAVIAAAFGVTRNTVCGKAHRLGLRICDHVPRVTKIPERRPRTRKPVALQQKPPPAKPQKGREFSSLDGARPISFIEASQSQCRWPIDDPEERFLCCGLPKAQGPTAYCSTHTTMAWRARP